MRDLRAETRLGWGEEERRAPQSVRFDVEVRFDEPPRACKTDELGDTVCYAQVADALKALCAGGEFRLIERLAREAHGQIRALCPPGASCRVEVTKLRPPVSDLAGGAAFFFADESFI